MTWTSVAVDGPWFVTVSVQSTVPPRRTAGALTSLAMPTSPNGTVVVNEAALFAVVDSSVSVVAAAVLTYDGCVAGSPGAVAENVTCRTAPLGSVPSVQVMIWPETEQLPVPPGVTATELASITRPAGTVSTSFVLAAESGPLFVTVTS